MGKKVNNWRRIHRTYSVPMLIIVIYMYICLEYTFVLCYSILRPPLEWLFTYDKFMQTCAFVLICQFDGWKCVVMR